MKNDDRVRTRKSEIAQLIILESLFSFRKSREMIFQGGTAIRWFYGGLRFSEDLDFVTLLPRKQTASLMESARETIKRRMAANFGTGSLTLNEKRGHPANYKAFVRFQPAAARNKISVKLEFEALVPGMKPDMDAKIMQASPAVSHFLREGGFKTPGMPVIVNVETAQEILSDKLRALLERPYKKGRDFFDVWFLTETLRIEPDASMLKRKLEMYEVPFTIRTPISFYTQPDLPESKTGQNLSREIHQDLSRFLEPETVEVLSSSGYRELISAVQKAFEKIMDQGVIDLNHSPKRFGA